MKPIETSGSKRWPPTPAGRAARGKVLVLGSDDRSFLSVVRSLGRRDLEVHVAWCDPEAPALRSRYLHRHHDIPRYRPDDPRWKSQLIDLLASQMFDLVVPCHDEDLLPLQLNGAELSRYARLCILEDGVYRIVANKALSHELALSLGVPVPAQVLVTKPDDLLGLGERLGWPMILKPRFSVHESEPAVKMRVEWAHTADQLSRLGTLMLQRDKPVVVQKHVRGRGEGVEVLCKDGRVLVAFQHERVHEPRHGGGSSYRRGVPLDASMLGATRNLMAALRYTGVAMVEYKRDKVSDEWFFVEINGRFWGSLPLAIASGVDFPYYLYQMMVEGRTEFSQAYRSNLFCRNLINDLGWYRQNRKVDPNDPSQIGVTIGHTARELGNLVLLRERSDTLAVDDPLPAASQISQLLGKALRRARRWARARLAGLGVLRSLSRTRVLSALKSGGVLLIVCKGNVCRSPYAQRVAARVLPSSVRIRSVGYFPVSGRRSPPEAVAVARSRGTDLADHESRVIDDKSAGEADAIAVFDDENREQLVERYPHLRKKVFYLGAFLKKGGLLIPDPWGGTIGDFQQAYDRIDRALEEMAARLRR